MSVSFPDTMSYSLKQSGEPDAEPGCNAASVEAAGKLWKTETDTSVFTVEMNSIIPFGTQISCCRQSVGTLILF